MRRFERFFRLPFVKFIYMPITAHEFLHFSHLAGISAKPPGLILNLVKLRSENIKELEKRECESHVIKKKITKREALFDKLVASSSPLIEALSVYVAKYFIRNIVSTGKLAEFIWDIGEEDYYRAFFENITSRLKRKVRITNAPKTLERKIRRAEENAWAEIRKIKIEEMRRELEEAFNFFVNLSIKRDIRMFYADLEWLGSQSSIGFVYFTVLHSLDIPLFDSESVHKLDLQYDPRKRFEVLMTKLKELNDKKPLKEIEIPTRYHSLPKAYKGMQQFVHQLVELKVFDPRERLRMTKRPPFARLGMKLPTNLLKDEMHAIEYVARWWRRYLGKKESFRDVVEVLTNKFISIPMLIKDGAEEYLVVSKELRHDEEWKYWWCVNKIFRDYKYGEKIRNPLQVYHLTLSDERHKKLKQIMEILREM
jgi:hypothetical protein